MSVNEQPPYRPAPRPLPRSRTRRRSRLASLSSYFAGEERQNLLVNVLFVGMIGVLLLILVGAVALTWYEQNLRPVARVGSVEISPGTARAYVGYRQALLTLREGELRQAQINGEISSATFSTLLSQLNSEASQLSSTAINDLIDRTYQAQLAAAQGISVSDADVDAELAKVTAAPERRHVLAIFVAPSHEGDGAVTLADERAALAKAQEAKAALDAGQDFGAVARQYSTDASAVNGGDYGQVIALGGVDRDWIDALFALPEGGTTDIIKGADGVYRIGRVDAITPGATSPDARSKLFSDASEEQVREFIHDELAARALRRQVVAEALSGTPDQVHLWAIYLAGQKSEDDPTATQGEISYYEIVFAPNHDLTAASPPPSDDPAWAAAKQRADNAYAQLSAITDPEQRATRFKELASDASVSDGAFTGEGGHQDFTTRDLLPDALGNALFEGSHEHNDVIGPVQTEAAWYLLMYDEKRPSFEQRLATVQAALAAPGADFATVAREHSEGPQKDDGGEFGWFTRDMLTETIVDPIFALQAGQNSDPIELGAGTYIFHVSEHQQRTLDPDQAQTLRDSAFDNWYGPKRDAADQDGTIVITGAQPTPTAPAF
jgi:parvulin-like peptidyl-prolyl isomerase